MATFRTLTLTLEPWNLVLYINPTFRTSETLAKIEQDFVVKNFASEFYCNFMHKKVGLQYGTGWYGSATLRLTTQRYDTSIKTWKIKKNCVCEMCGVFILIQGFGGGWQNKKDKKERSSKFQISGIQKNLNSLAT